MHRVLVVDDNDDFRSLLKLALEAEGFNVEVASNGQRILESLRASPAQVVVLDIYMPGKEGIETIQEMRKHFPDTQIIAMSGRSSVTDYDPLAVAVQLGAAKTLRKPFELDELINAVRALAISPSR